MRDSMAMSDAAVGLNLAGGGARLVALLIDVIILGIVGSIVGVIFGANPGEANAGAQIVDLIIHAAYFIGLITAWGTTIGGRVMGVKVVDAGGQPVSAGTAAIRWVMSLVSSAVILLGYLWGLWDSKKQTWHDKVAGTYVVKA